MGKLGGAMVGLGIFANNFIFVVDGGERAIRMSALKGLQSHVYGEGMHFKMPFIDTIIRFEIRTQPTMIHSTTGTNDMQTVNVSMRLLYRPILENLPIILSNIGQNYDERIIPSIGNEVLKSTIA
jgi:regulator of protease activity HflC (stomatin/prohibitin superfamily)